MSGRGRRPKRRPAGRDHDERDGGLATVWTAGAIAALLLLVAVVLAFGSATAIRHRTESAADLAAIAAAEYAPSGEQTACEQARSVADRMRVHITSCRLSGWDALVETWVDLPDGLRPFGPARAHARAGPVDG